MLHTESLDTSIIYSVTVWAGETAKYKTNNQWCPIYGPQRFWILEPIRAFLQIFIYTTIYVLVLPKCSMLTSLFSMKSCIELFSSLVTQSCNKGECSKVTQHTDETSSLNAKAQGLNQEKCKINKKISLTWKITSQIMHFTYI